MNFHGAGNNALSCLSMRCTSFVSSFAHSAVTSPPSVRPKVDSKVSRRSWAAVGLGGAAQLTPAHRGMHSRDLFESPNGAQSRRISTANGQKCITPPPEALVPRSRWQRVTRTHRLRISRIRSLPLVHETATNNSRSRSRLLPSYRKRVPDATMAMRNR
jgi:hypothetical protein